MIRLIKLEYLKLKHNRALWILLIIYVVCVAGVASSGAFFLEWLAAQGAEYRGIDPTVIPIYDFDDIWQNLTYVSYLFKIFPAFLLVISISNEYSFKTHRQNIIDGLSKNEFFLSKLSFAGFLAVLSGCLILVLGLILGGIYSPIKDLNVILNHIFFIPVHIYQLFLFFIFSMFLSILIKRSGITIIIILFYLIFEFFTVAILGNWYESVVQWFPLNSIDSLIHIPFSRYILRHTIDFVSLFDFVKATLWGGVFVGGVYYFFAKKDF